MTDFFSFDINVFRTAIETLFHKYSEINKQPLLYHYTDTNALLNGIILPNNKGKEICLRATRCTHLNDKEEIESGLKIIKESGDESLLSLADSLKRFLLPSCSLSLCKSADSLPMWGMYGLNGSGIMLAFDTKMIQEIYSYRLLPCIYENSKYDNDVVQKLKKLDFGTEFHKLNDEHKMGILYLLSAQFVLLRKNSAYEYEDEVRIIGIGNPRYEKYPEQAQFRISRGGITPFVNVYFPKEALKEVWLGPTHNIELAKDTTQEYFENCGFDVEVKISNVPYRG